MVNTIDFFAQKIKKRYNLNKNLYYNYDKKDYYISNYIKFLKNKY